MGQVTILPETIKDPLSFMGRVAGVAYNSDTSNQEKNKQRGLNCVRAGHGRMWEFCDIFLQIEGYSARVIREFMRHVGDGLTVIQRSTRYVAEDAFSIYDKYYTPRSIARNQQAKEIYDGAMNQIDTAYQDLVDLFEIPKEDAANLLPLGLDTMIIVKHNARTMIQMAEVRLCTRAYEEYRQLMGDIIVALGEYSTEWNIIVDEFFKCKCDKCGWCEEEYSCGKYPKKEDVVIINKEELERLQKCSYLLDLCRDTLTKPFKKENPWHLPIILNDYSFDWNKVYCENPDEQIHFKTTSAPVELKKDIIWNCLNCSKLD